MPADKILEPLRKCGVVGLSFCQRGIFHGIIVNKRGLNKLVLCKRVEQRNKHVPFGCRSALFNLYAQLFRAFPCVRVRFPTVVILARIFFNGLLHGQPCPRRAEVQLRALIDYIGGAANVFSNGCIQFLDQIHHCEIVAVSLIDLYRCKFGVVVSVHTLVAENSAHLVNAFKPADQKPL